MLEVAGGVSYHSALAFEEGPHRLVRRVWEVQIALVLAAGTSFAIFAGTGTGTAIRLLAAAFWFILGIVFVAGLYVFERAVAAWFTRAGIRYASDGDVG